MELAIELGKQIGAMISAVCEKELYSYAFDTMAYPITPRGKSLADWERRYRASRRAGRLPVA